MQFFLVTDGKQRDQIQAWDLKKILEVFETPVLPSYTYSSLLGTLRLLSLAVSYYSPACHLVARLSPLPISLTGAKSSPVFVFWTGVCSTGRPM